MELRYTWAAPRLRRRFANSLVRLGLVWCLPIVVVVAVAFLVTRKNRKLRKFRERYPGIRIKLFYKRDVERLAQRYRLQLAS